jgi:rRNA maturation RNase YbeY
MSERTARTRRPSGPPSPHPLPGGEGRGEGCSAGRDRPGHITVTNRQRRLPVDSAWLRRELTRVVTEENMGCSALSVVLVSDRLIRAASGCLGSHRSSVWAGRKVAPGARRQHTKGSGASRDFPGQAEVTDVLAFDYGPGCAEDDVEGEVVVSAERALAEARSRGLPPEGELLLYCIHGLLHLAGYEDATPARRERMWRRQLEHLARAGFPARLWRDGPRPSRSRPRREAKR